MNEVGARRRGQRPTHDQIMNVLRGTDTKFDSVSMDVLRPGDIVHVSGPKPMVFRVVAASPNPFTPRLVINELPLVAADTVVETWFALDVSAPFYRLERLRWDHYDWNKVELVWLATMLAGACNFRRAHDGDYVQVQHRDLIHAIDIDCQGCPTFNGRVVEHPIVQNLLTEMVNAQRERHDGV